MVILTMFAKAVAANSVVRRSYSINSNAVLNSMEDREHHEMRKKITNKALVVLLGGARGGERAWDSMFEFLLDPLGADLALAFGEDSDFPTMLTSRASHVFKLK